MATTTTELEDSPTGTKYIVNVSADSESKLEDLFKVLSADGSHQSRRMMDQGLPASLYKEPDRAEQQKKTLGPSIHIPQGGGYMTNKGAHHPRVVSLPADLNRYPRDDYHSIPLPPGWEIGKTPEGHTYFIK